MIRRLLLTLLAAVVAVATAVGPSRLAAATGLAPGAAGPQPDFLPEPIPVRVTSPEIRILLLGTILDNARIPLAGGGMSPRGTVLLQFSGIDIDQARIAQDGAGFGLSILNGGSGESAAAIGGEGQTVQLWGVLHHLEVCLSTLPGADPCPDVSRIVPVLAALTQGGGKLPRVLRGKNLDIDVYALRVTAPNGATSLNLPHGHLAVTSK
jgi:hypothetical protein